MGNVSQMERSFRSINELYRVYCLAHIVIGYKKRACTVSFLCPLSFSLYLLLAFSSLISFDKGEAAVLSGAVNKLSSRVQAN